MSFSPIRTPDEFSAEVRIGSGAPACEGLCLEFKSRPGHDEPDANERRLKARELARDVAQFANTDGGVLLYGVSESTDPTTGITTATGIAPVPNATQARDWIERAMSNYLYPAVARPRPSIIDLGSRGRVIAVNIIASAPLIAVWRASEPADGMEFVYRTTTGKEWMTPEDVERRTMETSRAKRLKLRDLLARVEDHYKWITLYHFNGDGQGFMQMWPTRMYVSDLGETELGLTVFGEQPHGEPLIIPYDWIAASWWGHGINDQGVRVTRPCIQVAARLLWTLGGLSIEPVLPS